MSRTRHTINLETIMEAVEHPGMDLSTPGLVQRVSTLCGCSASEVRITDPQHLLPVFATLEVFEVHQPLQFGSVRVVGYDLGSVGKPGIGWAVLTDVNGGAEAMAMEDSLTEDLFGGWGDSDWV